MELTSIPHPPAHASPLLATFFVNLLTGQERFCPPLCKAAVRAPQGTCESPSHEAGKLGLRWGPGGSPAETASLLCGSGSDRGAGSPGGKPEDAKAVLWVRPGLEKRPPKPSQVGPHLMPSSQGPYLYPARDLGASARHGPRQRSWKTRLVSPSPAPCLSGGGEPEGHWTLSREFCPLPPAKVSIQRKPFPPLMFFFFSDQREGPISPSWHGFPLRSPPGLTEGRG